SRRRHTRSYGDWSSDVCSSDLFFGPRAEIKVLKALGFIKKLRVPAIQDLFSLAFGAVMVHLSNYSYEPSLSSRPAVGKPIQNDRSEERRVGKECRYRGCADD